MSARSIEARFRDKIRSEWAGADGYRKRIIVLALIQDGAMTAHQLVQRLPEATTGRSERSRVVKIGHLLDALLVAGYVARAPGPRRVHKGPRPGLYRATDHALTIING